MSLIEKFEKLTSKNEIREEDKIKIWEAVQCFSEYISLVVRKGLELSVHLVADNKDEEEIERKYEKCIDEIRFINNLSKKFLGEKFFEIEVNRNEVEKFFWAVTSEVYINRRILRK